ncbi:MAG: hypothetical protein HY290_23815 [Planctomycetia bacterium]|nr:hypothetical protein [Planctomycetia bacterium]
MPLTLTPLSSDRPLERPWSREHVRAPHVDGAFVAQPLLSQAIDLANHNRHRLAERGGGIGVQGKDLASLRRWARIEVFRAARDDTGLLVPGDRTPSLSSGEIEAATFFVGGHQPTLFHPGVWVKNFVVGRLAGAGRGVGLNLVVDSDTLSATTIRVPTGPFDTPTIASVPFDAPRSRQPWEEAQIVDRALFESFDERVREVLGDRGYRPLLADFWPAAIEYSRRSNSLAECLTAARAAWERSCGVNNLELPVSRLCTLEPFLWFTAHLLAHLPRFTSIYNETLHEYRQVNGVRSRTHPVPDLGAADGWQEAPFRVWRAGDNVRRRVYVRQEATEILLSDGEREFARLPLAPDKDACCAVRELQKLAARGIRLRTRALTTTLFARLCFADLFVHGIGGAKYDQMTDRIIARFFGLAAPDFLTLSATVLLPLPAIAAHRDDENRLLRQLRELEYNSDRHLPAAAAQQHAALIDEKHRLVAEQNAVRAARLGGTQTPPIAELPEPQSTGAGYARFRRLQEINRRLAELTGGERQRMEEELRQTRAQLAASAVWRDREYASCLYPAEKLQRFMDHVCASTGGE